MTTQIIDQALQSASKLAQIATAAKTAFVERDETIAALTTALATGEHAIMLGKPGTSKTSIGKFFAESMGVKFFYRGLGPDIMQDDLFGPIDPIALQSGKWTRAWSGIATATIAFADEIGKASDVVANFLLEAMQERTVSISDCIHPINLHSLWSGSNESIHHIPAVWDRFSIRLHVTYIDDEANFIRMLRTSLDAPSLPVCHDELVNLRKAAKLIAMSDCSVANAKLLSFRRFIGDKYNYRISDRRWRSVLTVAAGAAMLRGSSTIEAPDMSVASWMMWDEVQQINAIHQFVEEECNKEARVLRENQALVNEYLKNARQVIDHASEAKPFEDLVKQGKLLVDAIPSNGQAFDRLRHEVTQTMDRLVDTSRNLVFNKLRNDVDNLQPGMDTNVYTELLFGTNRLAARLKKESPIDNAAMINTLAQMVDQIMKVSNGD